MIISNLIGGLGNQLFQYAAGYAGAARVSTDFRVAIDMFDGYRLHQGYELSRVFNVEPQAASAQELASVLGPLRHRAIRRVLGRLRVGRVPGSAAIFEPSIDYWSGIEVHGQTAYLHGYWQSERYFSDQVPAIRAALQFRSPPSAENLRWLERIDGCVSVSVHVRRGDYLTNRKNLGIYAACTEEYYLAAMARILVTLPEARFFVFSDDPAWACEALRARSSVIEIVDHNRGAESYNDLRLMSRCKHHVIANSTFSWWAAWLGERPAKIIIAPRLWLTDAHSGRDVVPDRWLRM